MTDPTRADTARPSSGASRIAVVVLLSVHAALAWLWRTSPQITTNTDEAAYILLARSLRDFSYRDQYLVGAPVHSQYPPGFPAFLATLSAPFGERFDVYIAGIILCSILALALLFDLVRRVSGPRVALTVLALTALNPVLIFHASRPLSEPLYMLLSIGALWAAVRLTESTRSTGRLTAIAIAAAIGAALTRTAGVTVILALLGAWLLQREFRRAAMLAGVAAATLGSWLAWTIVAPTQVVGRSYVADATVVSAERPGVVGTLVARVTSNVHDYAALHVPAAIPIPSISGTVVDNAIALAIVAVLGSIGIWLLWKRARPVAMYVALYAALLIAWPWNLPRFLAPVLPLLLWALVEGAFEIGRRWRALGIVAAALGALVLFCASVEDVRWTRDARTCFRVGAIDSPNCFRAENRGVWQASAFIRDSLPHSAIIVTAVEPLIAYQTDRRVVPAWSVGDRTPGDLLRNLRERGAEYFLVSPTRLVSEQPVHSLELACDRLAVVREFEAITLLLRVRADSVAGANTSACVALERYLARARVTQVAR